MCAKGQPSTTLNPWPGPSPARANVPRMPKNRTAFQSKLTQAERDAVVRAVIVDGDSSREVARKAQAGELDGVGKVDITDSYVRKLATRARADTGPEKLAQPGEADRAIDTARSRMLSYILHEQRRWETDAKAGNVDLPKAGRIMRALADYERTARGQTPKPQPGPDEPTENTNDQTADAIVRALLERSNGEARTEQSAASLSRNPQVAHSERPDGGSSGG